MALGKLVPPVSRAVGQLDEHWWRTDGWQTTDGRSNTSHNSRDGASVCRLKFWWKETLVGLLRTSQKVAHPVNMGFWSWKPIIYDLAFESHVQCERWRPHDGNVCLTPPKRLGQIGPSLPSSILQRFLKIFSFISISWDISFQLLDFFSFLHRASVAWFLKPF